jgi:hypothetical protein
VIASHVVPLPAGAKQVIFLMADNPAGLMRRAIWHEFVDNVWLQLLPVTLILIRASAATFPVFDHVDPATSRPENGRVWSRMAGSSRGAENCRSKPQIDRIRPPSMSPVAATIS